MLTERRADAVPAELLASAISWLFRERPWAQEPHPIDCSQCRDAARAYASSRRGAELHAAALDAQLAAASGGLSDVDEVMGAVLPLPRSRG